MERSSTPGVDFRYRIFNSASGDEVEHCGNGARCFVRYVHGRGLTEKTTVRVETVNNVLELQLRSDGRVTVDMNRPVFAHHAARHHLQEADVDVAGKAGVFFDLRAEQRHRRAVHVGHALHGVRVAH